MICEKMTILRDLTKLKKKLYTKIGTSLNIKNIHSSEE